MSRRVPSSGHHPEWPGEPERGQEYGDEYGAEHDGYGYGGGQGGYDQDQYGQYARPNGHQGYASQYGQEQYGQDQYGQAAGYGQQQPQGGQDWGYDGQPTQSLGYQGNGYQDNAYQGNGAARQGNGYRPSSYPGHAYPEHNGFENVRSSGNMRRYEDSQGYSDTQRLDDPQSFGDTQRLDDPQRFDGSRRLNGMQRPDSSQRFDDQRPYAGQGQYGPGGPSRPGRGPAGRQARDVPPGRKVRFRRTRRFFRRTSVRVVSAIVALFLLLVMFSAGQAAFKNNGQGVAANLAEWARDHYLGPVVTFGEWLSYNPPPKGGKPSFSLAVPSGEAVTSGKPQKGGKHKGKTFVPDIPAALKPLASGTPMAGEGQWRLAEKVKGNPAILTTFLRSPTYTSQVNGVASIDQRLVKFSLRPGTEDPGSSPWGYSDTYIPQGKRAGLLATFNGGFKLDSAGGGFYLNGSYHGTLVTGAASVIYYKNGTMKIGEWGRDFTMNSKIAGVRQNLKLIIDHGKISPNLNQDIMTKFGATLGGGYYVWRSGLGITKDGRIVYVYGPALNVQDLAELLHRAGAIEGMQMDINPAWMKFDYYQAKGNPADPTPVTLLPTQQPSAYSYYTASTRDFTAVFAR